VLQSTTVLYQRKERERVVNTGIELIESLVFVLIVVEAQDSETGLLIRKRWIHGLALDDPADPKSFRVCPTPLIHEVRVEGALASAATRVDGVVFEPDDGDVRALIYTPDLTYLPDAFPLSVDQNLEARNYEEIEVQILTPGTASDLVALDDLLFVADGADIGVSVLRLSPKPHLTPSKLLNTVDTPGSAQALALFGNLVLVADGEAGLSIVAFSPFPETGRGGSEITGALLGTIDTPGIAVDVAATGKIALVADSQYGLQVIVLPSVDYAIQRSSPQLEVIDISPNTANAVASYTVTFIVNTPLTTKLPLWVHGVIDTIVIRFPEGTRVTNATDSSRALPPGSIEFSVDDLPIISIPEVDGTGSVLLSPCHWDQRARQLTIAPPVSIAAGQRVTIRITPTARLINPPCGTNYHVGLSTTQSSIPTLSIRPYEIKPGPSSTPQNVRVSSICPDTEASNASYMVSFETSCSCGLFAGDLIEVTFPTGTWLRPLPTDTKDRTPIYIQVDGSRLVPVPSASSIAPSASCLQGPTLIIPVPTEVAPIGAHSRVALYFGADVGILNPPRGTNFTIVVKTTSDLIFALSDPYEIKARLDNARVTNVSSDVACTDKVRYTIIFTTTCHERLVGKDEDKIWITFPPGTDLHWYAGVQVAVNGVRAGAERDKNDTTGRTAVVTIPKTVEIHGGQRVVVDFSDVVNPPAGTNYVVEISTSENSEKLRTDSYEIKPCPDDARVLDISSDVALAKDASYTIVFRNTCACRQDGEPGKGFSPDCMALLPGQAIWITFPPGTALRSGYAAAKVTVNGIAATWRIDGSDNKAKITIPGGGRFKIAGGERVVIKFEGVTNPPVGTNYAVRISTSKDPEEVLTDPYQIRPDIEGLLGTLAAKLDAVIQLLGDIETRLVKIDSKLQEVIDLVKLQLVEGVANLISQMTGISTVLEGIKSVTSGLPEELARKLLGATDDQKSEIVALLERKVQLEEDLAALLRSDFEAQAEQFAMIVAYIAAQAEVYQLSVELLGSTVEAFLQQTERLVSQLDEKIDLEEEIRSLIDAILECLATLELSGEAIPPAERRPVDVVLAIDSSGSMKDNDPQGIRKAGAKAFVDQLDSTRDQVGLVSWDEGIDFSEDLTSNYGAIKAQIDRVDSDGSTNFDAGLQTALALLQAGRAESVKAIVFLTDGEPNADGYTPPGSSSSWVDKAKDAGIKIYAIGFGAPYGDPAVRQRLERMAETTGGKAFHGESADDLVAIYQEIARKLANPWIINLKATCED